ncbi:hypothetical protein FHQ26_07460 [Testudinibacter sp. TR-2022]|uniref:hypothetical protein n=1 Tax=Testudinibacter sp. TR-2022 TaxID=2585029 RepID=UPI00111814CA|nr:hypothetical protein [Testudinibacter sp. TR-2022]TNH02560.1 hypothetical protein FHQ22_09685 [Pasteurellaceae bacterium Phil31]TNH08368.1 hypothetical protein FHQ25_09585 [Testudinibacter sp. TR-2022]TNH09163.1 hypothetical protein FHQ26_07460 [Testudinibacter sp. TR-2022]TNH11052.1 hypothetical protein FIA56_11710 [Testudinibacter sp. TR-2022]TNH15052.1 hypothetical protein FHQ23_10265 [Testudinibacter sp. TR-2022]
MNLLLKYGSIFIAVCLLIVASTFLKGKKAHSLPEFKSIASYALPDSPMLDEFRSRINLEGPEYFLTSDQNITNLVLRYKIGINSSRPVHSISWLSLYTYQGHIIFNKEIQVVFNSGMDQYQSRSIDSVFPIDSISRNNRIFFLSPNPEIEAIVLPLSIQYLDGGRLEVPY